MSTCFPHIVLAWEDRCHHHNVPPFPEVLLVYMMLYVTGHPFGQLGQMSQHFPLPASCPSQSTGLLGVRELERNLDPVQQVLFSSSQITDVLTALFNTDAEPCTLRAAVRSSISSIPTSPDQHCNCTGITWDSEDTLDPLLLNPTCWICPSLFFAGFLCLRAVGWKQSSLFHDPWQDFTSELVEEVGFGEELLTSRVWDLHNLELFSTGVQTCTSAALCKCVCRHHWC